MKRQDQIRLLMKDKVLRKAIEKIGPLRQRRGTDLLTALLRAITGQQLSVKAADTIWNRFTALFPNARPDSKKLLALSDEQLRAVGLSYQKASYLKNIARFSQEQHLDSKRLRKMSDEELIDYLVQIKGVGRWTVEMVLMFDLNRPDVFPKDDLGIQLGIKALYGVHTTDKKALYAEMDRIAAPWRPCRTLACRYLWRYRDALS